MKRLFSILILFFSFAPLSGGAQEKTVPAEVLKEKSPNDYIPAGHFILKKVMGDLNKDGIPDLVLVAASNLEKTANVPPDLPRELIIFFKRPDSHYELKVRTSDAIMCKQCGGVLGDPLMDLIIERGSLVITHYGGSRDRWGGTHRFRYQDGVFYLIGKTIVTQDNLELTETNVDTNLLTGLTIRKDLKEGRVVSTTRSKKAPGRLTPLRELDIGKAFE